MAATGPGLGDVLDMALARRSRRPVSPLDFGAAGTRGVPIDRDISQVFRAARPTVPSDMSPDPMSRMFGTTVGQKSVNEIGNEGRTLAALQRLSLEILATALRITGQAADTDRLLVVPGERERPPILMVLSPRVRDANSSRVISEELDLPLAALMRARDAVADAREMTPEAFAYRQLLSGGPETLAELFLIAQPEVVLTRRPRMELLCVPSPHVRVDCSGEISTAGVLCFDQDGDFGVTACYHGTGPVGTRVSVGPHAAQVKQADPVQDTVFIPVGTPTDFPQMVGISGVLEDREPARADWVCFDGATNPNKSTRIFSTDAGLLRARPTIMLKLQTDPDADPGDSGSSLRDDQDRVLGFAFERTSYDDYPQFTDWIWAANALRALRLTPYK